MEFWEDCCSRININQKKSFQPLQLRQVLLLIVSDESSQTLVIEQLQEHAFPKS
jgi:hypothetical protein